MQTIPEKGILNDKVSSGILDKSKTSEYGFLPKAAHSRMDSENKFLKNLNLPTHNDNQTKTDIISQNNNSIQEEAKDNEDPKHKMKCLSTKRSKIIFNSVMSIIAVAIAIGVVCGVVYGIKENKKEIFVPKAEMVVNVKRELNDVCRYNRTKNTTFLMDYNGTIESMKEKVTTDFIVNIYDIDNNSTDSTIYHAYVLIIEMIKKNMSDPNADEESYGGVDIFQDSLSGVNDNDDFQIDEEDLADLNDEDKEKVISQSEALPLIKVSFYENGTIINTYYPPGLNDLMLSELRDVSSKVIPSITKELYTQTEGNKTTITRMLQEGGTENANLYTKNGNDTTLYNIENHGVTDSELDFSGSNMNSLTETNIDENEGVIKNISSGGNVAFVNDENDLSYNEPQIDPDSPLAGEVNDLNNSSENLLNIGLKSISSSLESFISLTNKTINSTITNRINEIANKLKFKLYEPAENNNTLRILEMFGVSEVVRYDRNLSDIPTIKTRGELKRMLKVKSFSKPVEFSYSIFKLNVIGLKILLNAVIVAEPNSGTINLDIVLTLSSIQFTIKRFSKESNLGWALSTAGEVLDDTIERVNNLIKKVKSLQSEWMNKIKENADALSKILSNVFNIATLYQEPMNKLFQNIQEFSKGLFDSLSNVIEKGNNEIEEIKDKVDKSSYPTVNKILNEVITQYKNYVQLMKDSIDLFHENGLTFINNINNALEGLTDFSVDVLYDILDEVEKAKNIYDGFADNLFNAVENGLNNFCDSMYAKVQELIGGALEIVEFIGNAMETNAIMKLVVAADQRKRMIEVTYLFRKKINALVDAIFAKIRETYENQVSSAEQSSLRDELIAKMAEKLRDFNDKTNKMLINIRSKIDSILQFEMYLQNLDLLDNIETNIMKITQEKFNVVFYEPLQKYKKYFSKDIINILRENIDNKTQPIITHIQNEATEAFEYMTELFLDYKEQFYYELNGLSEKVISFCRENLQYTYNHFNAMVINIETVMQNIIVTNYNYGKEYINDVYQLYQMRRGEGWYSYGRTGTYEQTCIAYTTGTLDLVNYLSENLMDILKTEYITIANNVKAFLRHYLSFDFLNKYTELTYIKQYIEYIYSLDERIDAIFNEDKFDMDFSMTLGEMMTRLVDYSTQQNDEFLKFKQGKLDHLPIKYDSGDFYYEEEREHTLHSPTYLDHTDNSGKRSNTKYIVSKIATTYFSENITAIITNFTNYMEPHLDNFKNITNTIYNSVIEKVRARFTDFSNLKTLLDKYETKSLEIISNVLENKLITNTYNNITENIENKIHTYFSFIADKVNTLNTNFFEKYLKVNISEYLEEPKEIIFKLEQILLNQLTKGETIVNDIESLLSNHFSLIIEESYLLINDILSSTMDNIYNFLPEFPFEEFLSSRTEYINSKVNTIRSAMQNSKAMFMDIIKQSEILQVDQNDFFKIKNQIETYKEQIVNQLETYINNIKEEIQSKAETFKDKVFDKYNFQVVKLRGAVKYFNEIKTLTKNILHKDNWKSFNYNDLYELFDYMSNYKLSHFVKEVQIYFKELNEKTMKEITPFLEIVNNNIRYVFEETINPQLITKQLTEYTNLLYRITEDFERNAFEYVDSLKNKVGNYLQNELNDIFAEAKVKNTTYYIDQQSLDNTYKTFENKIKDMFTNVKTSLESLEINENVLYESVQQYHKELDKGFDKIKEGINDFSSSLPEFTLLNITFSFQQIADIALNTSYLDAFKNDISFNASSIIRNNFPTIRPKLITMVNDIETNITTYLENKYQAFRNALLLNSKPISNITINVTAFTETFTNNILDAIETFNFNNTQFFGFDSITSLLQSNYPYAFAVFVFNIDKDYLKQQLEESIKVFQSVCENRLISEITEFQEILKAKLITKYNEVMKEFITKYGATYAKRIQNKLIDNNVVKIINTANEKLESLFDYVEYIFTNTSAFGETSILVFKQLLPQFAEELQEEITDKIESFLTSSLSKIESELSEVITNNFKDIMQKHEILRKAFTPQVMDVINEMFSVKLIDTFKSNFTSIFNLDCFDNLKKQLTQQFKLNINILKENLISKGNELIAILEHINEVKIPKYLNELMNYFNEYKLVIVNQVDSFVFALTEKPLEYFSTFVNDILAPLLNKINEYYDGLQDKILAMVSEKVDQFENFLQIVQDNMPTKIIVEFAQGVHKKIDEVLEGIRTFVLGKMNEFEAAIINKLNEWFSLRQIQQTETSPTAIAIRNTGLSDSLNIQQLLDSIKSIKKILDDFADQIINLKNVSKMFGSFYNFQSIIQNGIKQIKNPLNSIVSKLQTFLTPNKLSEFKNRIESEIEEIIGVATYHYDQVKEIIELNIHKIKTYPRELFEDVKDEAKDILNNLMDTALTKLLNYVHPFKISDKKTVLEHPKYQIVIMVLFIPFNFKLAFDYGFEYGIEFGTKDLAIYVDAFGEAYASVYATAGVGFGILEFGAGIGGDLGRGRVAIRPIFSLKSFSVELDAYIRISAFNFKVLVTMTYPVIKLKKIKIKICRWLKITIYIPIIVPVTRRYGGIGYEGVMFEKHFLKDY